MQIEKLLEDGDSSSSDGFYSVIFGDFQFLQGSIMRSKYSKAARMIYRSKLKKKYTTSQDTKSLLLDTGSTISCCNNPKMLVNIRKSARSINGISNEDTMVTYEEGDFPGDFTVYILTPNLG